MEVHRNLISDSGLVQETFDLLRKNGGRTAFTKIVDVVFRLSHAGEDLAASLVGDLVRGDPRFSIQSDHLAIIDDSGEDRLLNQTEFVVLDVEAIGARNIPARVIELGAYRLQSGKITGEFQTLINPEVPLPRFITALTGITDPMVAGAPRFAEVVGSWLDFSADAVLVAHNAMFDLPLLNQEIARVFPGCRMRNAELCTVKLARRLMPSLESHSLDALADHFACEIQKRHRAAGDAKATTQILLRLLDQMEHQGVRTLAEARVYRSTIETPSAGLDLQLALNI